MDEPAKPRDIVEECKKRLQLCIDAEPYRADALDDLQFLAGDQWNAADRRVREAEGRPCLTINSLPAMINQVVNDNRQNKQSVKVHPVDSMADPKTAEVIQGIIRHIEYDSDADSAYDTAVANAARVGFGYFRVVTEYCDETSFDQDIKIRRIRNPFSVYFDPDSIEADGSDARYAIIISDISHEQFKLDFPDKKQADNDGFSTGIGNKGWWTKETIRIAEYYYVEETPDTLLMLATGEVYYRSEIQEGAESVLNIVRERQSTRRQVKWCKLSPFEVLEETIIPCRWVPVFPVWGDEIDIDSRLKRTGLIRYAKDPARMYNYWVTSATEEVAMRTKTPWIGAVGAFETAKADWEAANRRSFPYLEYDLVTGEEGQLAPPPSRQPMADVPVGTLQMAMHARDNIKAVTGIYDASLGARSNETSGIAIRNRQRQGDTANFHYADNLAKAIRHLGRCIVDMIPKVYDTQRVMRIMGEDGTSKLMSVNDPTQKHVVDLQAGKYDVTVSSGPAYSTLRQEAAETMVDMAGKWPQLMEVAGDKVVRAMDWPGAQEIADRIEKTLPPGLQEPDEGQEDMVMTPNGPIPKDQAGAIIGQLDQALNQAQAELDQMNVELEKARVSADASVRVAEINADSRVDVEILKAKIDSEYKQPDKDAPKPSPAPSPAPEKPKTRTMEMVAPDGGIYRATMTEE